jgi:hypothetical protein
METKACGPGFGVLGLPLVMALLVSAVKLLLDNQHDM